MELLELLGQLTPATKFPLAWVVVPSHPRLDPSTHPLTPSLYRPSHVGEDKSAILDRLQLISESTHNDVRPLPSRYCGFGAKQLKFGGYAILGCMFSHTMNRLPPTARPGCLTAPLNSARCL